MKIYEESYGPIDVKVVKRRVILKDDNVPEFFTFTPASALVSPNSYTQSSWTEEDEQKIFQYLEEHKTFRGIGSIFPGRKNRAAYDRFLKLAKKDPSLYQRFPFLNAPGVKEELELPLPPLNQQ